ncbi:hypothetical protein VPH35_022144 [Triticum aestivum]
MQALLLASAAQTAEVAALKQDLEGSKKELGPAKRQLEENKGATTEVATLRQALSEAEEKAAKERAERKKQEARVGEVQQEPQALVAKHEALELDSKTRESELAAALESAKNAKAEAQKALQEIEAMKKIAAGKAFFMQSKHVKLKQLVELHKAAEQAMKGFIVRMWPGDALPNSYFGLVRQLIDACPWLEVIKRSVCIEGARWAFARAKVHWAKMDAVKLVKEGPPQGKEHRNPEMYYEGVLKGTRIVADECAKDVIFE